MKTTLFPFSPLKRSLEEQSILVLYIHKSPLWSSSGPPTSASSQRYAHPPQHIIQKKKKKKMQTVLACFSLCFWEFICKHFSTDENRPRFIGLLCKSGLRGCYHLGWAVCMYWLWSLRNSCKDKTIPKVLDCIYSTILFLFSWRSSV